MTDLEIQAAGRKEGPLKPSLTALLLFSAIPTTSTFSHGIPAMAPEILMPSALTFELIARCSVSLSIASVAA
jgi:hypothetical protein